MSRSEFMAELRKLLVSIPEEEREEALQYYENYFEDAGPENEENVIKELGSPEKVASIIWTDSKEGSRESGEFTETGYTDVRFDEKKRPACRENRPQKRHEEEKAYKAENAYSYRETSYTTNGQGVGNGSQEPGARQGADGQGQTDDGYGTGGGYGAGAGNGSGAENGYGTSDGYGAGGGYGSGGYRHGRRASGEARTNKPLKIVLIIVLGVLILRMFGWLVPAAFGGIMGILGIFLGIFGCLVGFALAGVGIAVAGVAVLVVGISGLAGMFASAILVMGVGLLLLGLGVALTILMTKLCMVVYPAVFRFVVNLVRRIFYGKEAA